MDDRRQGELSMDDTIFYPTIILLLFSTIPLLFYPEASIALLDALKVWIEDHFGSLYQLLAIAVVVFVMAIAFSRYGKIQLGHNEYNFSTFSWMSMLFCAGVATGILYWGTIEWGYYVDQPPFDLEAGSPLALEYAATYGMFHWGIIGWSFYSLPAIAIGYMYYIKKVPVLRISKACRRILGRHADTWLGRSIDIFFMLGLLGSAGTSMGLGTPMISAGLSSLLGLQDTFNLKIVVIICCAVVFSISVYMGLGKGIKRLSNINTSVAFVFLLFVFLVGPTAFMTKMTINSMGLMASDFIRMITWTDPINNTRFVEDWSIFYWAWWVAVGPFMGIFIAKISGGRTIKQVILGTVILGSAGSVLFYGVLGNYALHLELSGELPVLELIRAGKPADAIIATITSLDKSKLVLFCFCIMSVLFMATSFDSTSYALAACATKKLEVHQDPSRWQRLFWAFTLIVLPLSLMYIGGLDALKIAVLISALPLIIVFVIMMLSLYKNLQDHTS